MQENLKIRLANITDLPSITNIYNQAIRTKSATGDLTEFTVEQRIGWFNKFDNNTYPLYVAEIENNVVGYCTISPYRPGREAMLKTAEISFFIDFSFHKLGIGSSLMEYAISDCKRTGKESLLAILLDINTQSIAILKKFNFSQWGHFPNIINIDGRKCGHLVYGLEINKEKY